MDGCAWGTTVDDDSLLRCASGEFMMADDGLTVDRCE
jgi:hypothetical protein